MINHTVLFKLIEFESGKEKEEAIATIKEQLLGLQEKVDVLKHIEVESHYTLDSPSFDIALISHFESMADIDIYQVHPDHVAAVGIIKPYFAGRACVDFEF